MAALEQELEALELETEDELEGEFEAEGELEFESEFEDEAEGEISPVRKIYADAMMEHMAHMAAEAETEQEAAEHFLPLIGMAASKLLPVVAKAAGPLLKKALPQVAKAVTRVTPQLTPRVSTITRSLHRNPNTRGLLHAVPSIARRTVHSLARQAAHGKHITPRSAVRTLARQTNKVLSHRPHRLRALRQLAGHGPPLPSSSVAPGVARPHGSVRHGETMEALMQGAQHILAWQRVERMCRERRMAASLRAVGPRRVYSVRLMPRLAPVAVTGQRPGRPTAVAADSCCVIDHGEAETRVSGIPDDQDRKSGRSKPNITSR